MLSYLEDVRDYDTLWFLPIEDEESSLHVTANQYKEAGEPIGGGLMGPEWHIVLFKSEQNDPREYISSLIPQGWYGLVARKTTTSNKFIESVIDKIKNM